MGGWGLLIFYVTNVCFVTKVAFCISPYAYHAYLCQNSRRIRHLRRPRPANHTLTVRPHLAPLKREKVPSL